MQNKTVLLVDDDEDILAILDDHLSSLGYQVTKTGNGADCLHILEKGEIPSIIIMDIRMPIMDGITTLKQLCSKGIEVPVVVYSGFLDSDTIAMAESLGAKAAYAKPMTPSSLENAIKNFAI